MNPETAILEVEVPEELLEQQHGSVVRRLGRGHRWRGRPVRVLLRCRSGNRSNAPSGPVPSGAACDDRPLDLEREPSPGQQSARRVAIRPCGLLPVARRATDKTAAVVWDRYWSRAHYCAFRCRYGTRSVDGIQRAVHGGRYGAHGTGDSGDPSFLEVARPVKDAPGLGRTACQRASHVLRCAATLTGDTPSAPPLRQQLWALRPGLDGNRPGRPHLLIRTEHADGVEALRDKSISATSTNGNEAETLGNTPGNRLDFHFRDFPPRGVSGNGNGNRTAEGRSGGRGPLCPRAKSNPSPAHGDDLPRSSPR